MLKINPIYLDRFKEMKNIIYDKKAYFYELSKGAYLSFDGDTLEYQGLELYFLPKYETNLDKKRYKLINELLKKGLLEIGKECEE